MGINRTLQTGAELSAKKEIHLDAGLLPKTETDVLKWSNVQHLNKISFGNEGKV